MTEERERREMERREGRESREREDRAEEEGEEVCSKIGGCSSHLAGALLREGRGWDESSSGPGGPSALTATASATLSSAGWAETGGELTAQGHAGGVRAAAKARRQGRAHSREMKQGPQLGAFWLCLTQKSISGDGK